MDQDLQKLVQDMRAQIERLSDSLRETKSRLESIHTSLHNSRVKIQNFEGSFKVFEAVPTDSNFQDGSIVFSDDGATRKINARINGAWRSATMT